MRTARHVASLLRPIAFGLVLAVGLAACAGSTPGWTFSPTPTPTAAPSGAPTAGPSAAPTAGPSGEATPAASDGSNGGAAVTLKISAQGLAFDTDSLEVPANTPFKIEFTNNDAGIPHNVAIHEGSPTGREIWRGEVFNGVGTRTYDVPALPAGTYGFICSIHPNMTGTLTAK